MPAISVHGLVKRYGATVAVRGVSVAFDEGQLHAVIGENGAGKSTLLKIACGLVEPDEGSVEIDGKELLPHTPREAIARGVGMVQQHFALIEPMTVLENVMLGAETTKRGLLDEAAARARLATIAEELGVRLHPSSRVRELGVGDRQRLEIARVIYKGARVVVLDEPTAVLVPSEADALYATLKRLVGQGKTIIVVTHKLDEVSAHAQTVTVMRKGKKVLSGASFEPAELRSAIMGGEPPESQAARRREPGDDVLRLDDVTLGRELRGVSLRVRAGEIVGIAGVEGNGQRELVRLIAGLEHADGGRLVSSAASVVHEDRQHEGLVLDASVMDNLLLGELGDYSTAGWLRQAAMEQEASRRAAAGGVVPPDITLPVRALSGGNQQKVVVARGIARGARVLVLAHPTRGVDIGAATAIHDRIRAAAASGIGVLVVSSDLGELRSLCGRILVMARGRMVADVQPDTSNERLGALMLGAA